jgi:hypothetical protein
VRAQIVARRIKRNILCLPLASLLYLESLVVKDYPTDDLRGYAG